jgi:hypothetical protein
MLSLENSILSPEKISFVIPEHQVDISFSRAVPMKITIYEIHPFYNGYIA